MALCWGKVRCMYPVHHAAGKQLFEFLADGVLAGLTEPFNSFLRGHLFRNQGKEAFIMDGIDSVKEGGQVGVFACFCGGPNALRATRGCLSLCSLAAVFFGLPELIVNSRAICGHSWVFSVFRRGGNVHSWAAGVTAACGPGGGGVAGGTPKESSSWSEEEDEEEDEDVE